jgi:CBS domain-containing protein
MSVSTHPAASYMTTALATIRPDAPTAEAAAVLAQRRVSALPVIDDRGSIVGVLSRSDLVHDQRRPAAARAASVGALMTQGPILAEPTASLGAIAKQMIEHRIHRVFLVEGGALRGVVSTTDLTRALAKARVDGDLGSIMSAPVATIDVGQSLSLAMEWLDRGGITGLIVTEHDWPIGMFTQEEVLAARDLDPTTPVGELLDPSLVCLPITTSIHRAAAQAGELGVRRIVVSKNRDFVGLVSGLDFAGVVAGVDL